MFVSVVAGVLLAAPAFAQEVFKASVSFKCTEEVEKGDSGDVVLSSFGAGRRELLAICMGRPRRAREQRNDRRGSPNRRS